MAKPTINDLLRKPEFNQGLNLLMNSELILRLQRGSLELRMRLSEVEPFNELLDARYKGPFDRGVDGKERQPGELFVLWPHGQPTLSTVVDPERRSIVVLKQYLPQGHSRMTLSKLLTTRELGNMKPEAAREFVRGLDGVDPSDKESALRIEPVTGGQSVSFEHDASKAAPNSWGKITLINS